jgi:hypothetical protein
MACFHDVKTGQDVARFAEQYSKSARTLAISDDGSLVAVKFGGNPKPANLILGDRRHSRGTLTYRRRSGMFSRSIRRAIRCGSKGYRVQMTCNLG